ncbi:hypothetical protein [Variovorax sp. JS1663]|uniref:hypothetical protein n=1 Tax=Variovorax sp. JS1663 TaxID=1851577 RepID=UPI00117EDBD2|nr:hypothetical protein [Variovorax sp. JS1663]
MTKFAGTITASPYSHSILSFVIPDGCKDVRLNALLYAEPENTMCNAQLHLYMSLETPTTINSPYEYISAREDSDFTATNVQINEVFHNFRPGQTVYFRADFQGQYIRNTKYILEAEPF